MTRSTMIGSLRSLCFATALLAFGMVRLAAAAESPQTVQAVWQPQEVTFQYFGSNTAYNCDSLSDKLERILVKAGVREGVRVSTAGCFGNRPQRSISVRIAMLAPVTVGDKDQGALSAEKQQEVIKRVGGKSGVDMQPFAATWETIDLSKDRALNIEAGDCELIEQLRKNVLPKLRMKIVDSQTSCIPNQISAFVPRLIVSALVPLKQPDAIATPKS
jgi:hypothetical protein